MNIQASKEFNQSLSVKGMRSNRGLTLIEIMMAIAILGMSSFGLLAGLLQSRQMTEAAIYQGTALTIGQGYMEQIKNMEFASLDESTLPTLFHEGSSDTLAVSPTPSNPEIGNSNTDILNTKTIDINIKIFSALTILAKVIIITPPLFYYS